MNHTIDLIGAVCAMPLGGEIIYPNTHLSTMEIASLSSLIGREFGFGIRYGAGYGGVKIKKFHSPKLAVGPFMDRMSSGEPQHFALPVLDLPHARKLAAVRNDTGLAEFAISVVADGIAILRTDLHPVADATTRDFSQLRANGWHVFSVGNKPKPEKQFRADLLRLALISRQPYAAVRLDDHSMLASAITLTAPLSR